MKNVLIRNKLMITLAINFTFCISSAFAKEKMQCIEVEKQKVCVKASENKDGESVYYLLVNRKKSHLISYYDNALLKKISNKQFRINSSFLSNGQTDISTIYSINGVDPFIEKFETVMSVNNAPKGILEKCNIPVKKYLTSDINDYVDNLIFNMSENDKKKYCISKQLQ